MTNDRRRRAVALRYNPGRDAAPVVIAKGAGARADRIKALARAHGIVVREDPALVAAFARIDEQAQIPPELYAAVAELLAYVHRADRRAGRPGIPDPVDP